MTNEVSVCLSLYIYIYIYILLVDTYKLLNDESGL
jgi:hypothetical protein